jgi:hypothetical protein
VNETVTPYLTHAVALWNAGWSPLPLPPRAKKNPPDGYTGYAGVDPTREQVAHWLIEHPDANIGVRFSFGTIGIDVDAYGDKPGAATLAALEAAHGALPATVKVTSRDDAVSGIRLYRLPAGAGDTTGFRTGWPGIEILRREHRYMVGPGSIHPDTAATYRAIDEATGVVHVGLPPADQLPILPDAWVAACRKQSKPKTQTTPNAPQSDWQLVGPLCKAMHRALEDAVSELHSGACRHDTATARSMGIARLAEQGHIGGEHALHELGEMFQAAVAADRPGGAREAAVEWRSMVETAKAKVNADPTPETDKRCCVPASGGTVAEQLAGLIPAPREHVIDLRETPKDATSPAAGGDSGDETPSEQTPSSWVPMDLTPYLSGTWKPQAPTMLRRGDGHGLLYPGLVHSIFGEAESGKSWVSQIAVAETLAGGGSAAIVDFESDPGAVIARLLALGASPTDITARLDYIRPETRPRPDDPAWGDLLGRQRDLVVIDGLTEALVTFGAKTVDNDEVSAFIRYFPKRVADQTGAAVLTIDHQSKDKDNRGRFALGAQAKMAAITGAAYIAEPITALAPGCEGRIVLRVAKDRPGGVRAQAGVWRASDRTQHAATVVIDSTSEHMTWQVLDPDSAEAADAERRAEQVPFRPTVLMERVSRFLESNGDCSRNVIRSGVQGKAITVDQALDLLVEEGYVARFDGPRGAINHRVIAVYREIDELSGAEKLTSSRPRPDLVPVPVNVPEVDLVPRPPPLRGRDEVNGLHKTRSNSLTSSQDQGHQGEVNNCQHCAQTLAPALAAAGYRTHPTCDDPDNPPFDDW